MITDIIFLGVKWRAFITPWSQPKTFVFWNKKIKSDLAFLDWSSEARMATLSQLLNTPLWDLNQVHFEWLLGCLCLTARITLLFIVPLGSRNQGMTYFCTVLGDKSRFVTQALYFKDAWMFVAQHIIISFVLQEIIDHLDDDSVWKRLARLKINEKSFTSDVRCGHLQLDQTLL